MKIYPNQIKTVQWKKYAGCVIYGSDVGAGQTLIKDIIAEFNGADIFKITDENQEEFLPTALSSSMFCTQKVIWVRSCPDSFVDDLIQYTEQNISDTFVIFSAETLNTKSKTVLFANANERWGCVGFYPEKETDIRLFILSELKKKNFVISNDALDLFVSLVGADKMIMVSEIEKLILYKNQDKNIQTADILKSVGNSSVLETDDLFTLMMSGQITETLALLNALLGQDHTEVEICRFLLSRIGQCITLKDEMDRGGMWDVISKKIYPPIHFNYVTLFKQILFKWSVSDLSLIREELIKCEINLKSDLPPNLMLNRTISQLSSKGRKIFRS